MDFMGREGAPLDKDMWECLDGTVVSTISKLLVGRRFISIAGPLGAGCNVTKIDRPGHTEEFKDGIVKTVKREYIEIPQLYSDFWLYWRDLANAQERGAAPDMAKAAYAAQQMALIEDKMIFYGIEDQQIEGLLNASGSKSIKRSDWTTGEGAFKDVATAVTTLESAGFVENHVLVVSPDLYLQLQRIQPGTGVIEAERISHYIGKKIYKSAALAEGTALMLSAAPYCVDLLLGQDITTSYLEAVDLNHHFRILETALLRIKCPQAIVIFN